VRQILSAIEELSKEGALNIGERHDERREDGISVIGSRTMQIKGNRFMHTRCESLTLSLSPWQLRRERRRQKMGNSTIQALRVGQCGVDAHHGPVHE
jgi:hypothetical protein